MPSARIHEIVLKVEVANGSGVAGLAKRTSSSLQKRGYAVSRLTNQIPYMQVITEIQYRRGEKAMPTSSTPSVRARETRGVEPLKPARRH